MHRKFLFFINPISGEGRKKNLKLIKIIKDSTNSKNFLFEIIETNEDGNYPWLIDKLINEKFTEIIVCGGDGTINKIAKLLLHTRIKIGIIPSGSGNGLALSLKIPLKTEDALNVIFNGKNKYIDAFNINDNFSCMLCGIGMDARIAQDFANDSKRGLSTYIKQSIKNFVSSNTFNFTIKINGNNFNTDAFFISIANSNQFGNNFTIAPKAILHDGLLDVIVVQKMHKAKLIWAIGKQMKFGKISEIGELDTTQNTILYFQTDKLTIINHDGAPLHIDGDPAVSASQFKIKILPKALRFFYP